MEPTTEPPVIGPGPTTASELDTFTTQVTVTERTIGEHVVSKTVNKLISEMNYKSFFLYSWNLTHF